MHIGEVVLALNSEVAITISPARVAGRETHLHGRRQLSPSCWGFHSVALGPSTPILDHLMSFPRTTPIVLMCLLAGCRTTQEISVRIFSPVDTDSVASIIPAHSNPTRLTKVSMSRVQQVAFIQPTDPLPLREPHVLATPAAESGPDWTLAQLEQIALANNPSLAEARARINGARGKWVQVGLPPNLVLGYSGQQLGSGGLAEQHGLYVEQELVRGGKLRMNRAIVSREIQKAQQLLAAQEQRVLTDVRLAFYEVLVSQRRNETAGQLVQIARQEVELGKSLLKAQEIGRVDVIRARIELQTAQLAEKHAASLFTAAWSRLIAVAGVPDMQPRPIQGDVECMSDEISVDEVLARLRRESPELAAALSEVERARWAVYRAYAEPVPNVNVQAIAQSDNGTDSSNASLLVSMPIPLLNRNQGGIRQAQAEVLAAERAVDRLQLSFQQRLASVYQRYMSARDQVHDYSMDGGILDNSEESLELVRKGNQAGELSYLDLIAAQRTFSQTSLAYIEALGELWAAVVEIDGLLLKGSLDGWP